ncbi:MAG: trypsin-like peptidase domain-containing protein, partial [Planctomycetota bacterium]
KWLSLRDQTIQGGIRVVRYRQSIVLIACLLAGVDVAQEASAQQPGFPQRRGQQPVLLDFWLPTCGPCRAMDPLVRRLQAEGYPIRRVDGSRDQQLAQQFRVDRYPTFILVSGGRELHRSVGPMTEPQMRQLMASAGVRPAPRLEKSDPRSAVVPATFAQPVAGASPGGEAFQVGSDLGAVPEVTIPGQPSPTANAAAVRPPAAAMPVPPQIAGVPVPGRPVANNPIAGGPDPQQLLSWSVRLKVQDTTGSSFGTGTIIDARQGEALVLTCAHLFRDGQNPISPATPIVAELFQASAAGAVVAERTSGQLISFDEQNDVALVSIRPRGTVAVARVAADRESVANGAAVWSVGCDHGANPTVRTGRVTSVDRYTSPLSLTVSGAPVVGRSGGGLFNERGELVGVCFGAREQDNEGYYAKLASIHAELDKLGLTSIYREGATAPTAGMVVVATPAPNPPARPAANPPAGLVPVAAAPEPPVFRGQTTPPAPPMGNLTAAERAALEELTRRAAESEVVCVIRPKQPGGRSEVITLDTVSPAFLQALRSMSGTTPR